MRPYKNLFFDLDDTLWAFTENARAAFRDVYGQFGFDRYFDSFDDFYDSYTERNHVLWVSYGQGAISKEELNYERFSYPLLQAGVINDGLVRDYMRAYFDIVPTKQALMPHALDILAYLRRRGYRLYILSNGFRELQEEKMRTTGLDVYFDKVILSDDLKVNKPNEAIFHFALSATQSELRDSLMIGDNFEADIAGAAGVGMDQVFYNHRGKRLMSFRPTYEITSLLELRDWL